MENKTYNDVMKELGQLEANGMDVTKCQERAKELMEELELLTKKAKKETRIVALISSIFCVLIVAFAAFVNMSNKNLKSDVNEKNAIIGKYEQMVSNLGGVDNWKKKSHKADDEFSVNELVNENYQLLQRISDLENKMKLIKNEYGINVIDNGKSYYLQANKVDSALMLLNVYRDKIHYDNKKNEWIVVR